MKLLYINDELATCDGSNYHALGIYHNLIQLLGKENVRSYPVAADGSSISAKHSALAFRKKYKSLLQLLRPVRKSILSHTRAWKLIHELQTAGFVPTHVLARCALFDTTAQIVAKHFSSKLVYEVNAPMYHEHCIMNGLPLRSAVERWERRILHKCDGIYVVSKVCRDMLCEHYGISPEQFTVIPNGYLEELFSESTEKSDITGHKDKFVVSFVGSLKSWHGIDRLCEIAAALEAHPHIHFVVAGDGNEHAQVERYCATHSNMTFKGKLPLRDMASLLLNSDLGIMPYHTIESFYFSPLKMYDMIGAGLPFLGSGQGQVKELCEEELSPDFLLQSCTVSEATTRILQLSANPETLHSMKLRLQALQPHVTWQARTARVLTYLRSL